MLAWDILLPSASHMLTFFPAFMQPAFIEHLVSGGNISMEQTQKYEGITMKWGGQWLNEKQRLEES